MDLIQTPDLARAIVEDANDAIFAKGLDGTIWYWNPGAERLFGYTLSEAVGQNITMLIPEDRLAEEARIAKRIAAGSSIKHFHTFRRTKEGALIQVSISVSPIHDEDGQVIGASNIARDVTDQRTAETLLLEPKEHLRAVVENIVEGIITIDSRGIIASFNPAAERIFGYSEPEVVGKNVSMLMPSPWAESHDGYIQNFLRTGEAKIIGIGREVTGMKKDGTTFPAELAISEMRIGNQTMFTGIIRDVTLRKDLETALVAARDEAVEANNAKSQFLASMSHELRTPLNGILGFAELLSMDKALSETHKGEAKQILSAGRHLLALIDDLLDLSRIESGAVSMVLSRQSLRDVIAECINILSGFAEEAGVQIKSAVHDDVDIIADETRFRQVLLNLLSNSIKYNNPGGFVSVSSQIEEQFATIEVSDTGIGIPKKKLDQVFTAFNRLGRESGTRPGTGIGLYIAQQLAEGMGGAIGFKTSEGKGTTFWIKMPISKTEQSRSGETTTAATGVEEVAGTIIYVEDNPLNVQLVERIIGRFRPRLKFHSYSAAGDAIAQSFRKPPDLILMDINLPGMSGYEALSQLKANRLTQNIPVVALTANARGEDIERGRAAGFDIYLTKPVATSDLLQAIDSFLRNSAD